MFRRKLIWVFVAVICLPAATMLELGRRLLDQDRRLATEYQRERREQAADRTVQSLRTALSEPALFQRPAGPGAILVSYPDGPVMFRPDPAKLPEAAADFYSAAESIENTGTDPMKAVVLYRQLTSASDAAVRAGAWVRLARTLRKAHNDPGALAAYTELSHIETVAAAGWPATLAAAWGRCTVLREMGREAELRQEALRLRTRLDEGAWPLTHDAYSIFADDVVRWTAEKRPIEREALTDAANRLWGRVRNGEEAGEGRRFVVQNGEPITLIWKTVRHATVVLAASMPFVRQSWLNRTGGLTWLRDDKGLDLTKALSTDFVLRYPAETGLPWVLAVAAPAGGGEFAARRQLLLVLLFAVGLFTMAGGYFCLRMLRREFVLARMQSDFVAAVSHEFRTPLTSMRMISEALEDDRIPDPDRRRDSYHALSRASGRLQRLVEDLLDFRRMESGAAEYRMRSLNVADTIRNVVEEFRKEVESQGFRVYLQLSGAPKIKADESAFTRVLWNLLDNAAKYSGESHDIDVSLEHDGARIAVSVKDRGIGIAPGERAHLFDRFYRTESARRAGIRGTGIGLAMAAQIAAAHGGKIVVDSELGHGSTFTLSLPVEQA
jgi:signal transduction histidine kinase